MSERYQMPVVTIAKMEFDQYITASAWHYITSKGIRIEDLFRSALIPMIRDYMYMRIDEFKNHTIYNQLLETASGHGVGGVDFQSNLLKIMHNIYEVLYPYFREYINEVVVESRWDRTRVVVGDLILASPMPSVFAIRLTLDSF